MSAKDGVTLYNLFHDALDMSLAEQHRSLKDTGEIGVHVFKRHENVASAGEKRLLQRDKLRVRRQLREKFDFTN